MKWSFHAVYSALNNAVFEALRIALEKPTQKEPQLVANLVWQLPKQINGLASSKYFTVKAGGVFVHGQPFVKCDDFPEQNPKSVEIGDLLLLRTDLRNKQEVKRSALLLQAKKTNKLPMRPDKKSKNQHHLYATWPEFKYVQPKPLTDGLRHITGLDLYNASKYLLIAKSSFFSSAFWPCPLLHWPFHHCDCCCTITAQPSMPELTHYRCFIQELIDFILGNAGKAFDSPPLTAGNWDRVIDDLVKETANRQSKFMARASHSKPGYRGAGNVLTCCVGQLQGMSMLKKSNIEEHGMDGPPHVPEEWPSSEDNEGGISIIEFVVGENEERREE